MKKERYLSVTIDSLSRKKQNEKVSIKCWLRYKRFSKTIIFLNIRDGSNAEGIQVVCRETATDNDFERNKKTLQGIKLFSAVEILGILQFQEEKKSKEKIPEIKLKEIKIISNSENFHPIQKQELSEKYLRTIPHFRPKTSFFTALFRIRSKLTFIIHQFFDKQGFIFLHSPIITTNDCEGGGETFTLEDKNKFFKKKVYLSVSGQLFAESFAQNFQKTYTFGPTFRRDPSLTSRHAAEFWMIEPEITFFNKDKLIVFIEKFVKETIRETLKKCQKELKTIGANVGFLKKITNEKFIKISYKKAISIIESNFHETTLNENLNSSHEKFLCDYFQKPVFVTDYPAKIKPFYMKRDELQKTATCVDLLVPQIGELIGGSERENNHQKLLENIKNFSEKEKNNLKWYLELRKYGYAPSAGFGLGFERLLMFITGVENIREVIPFPRTKGKIEF